ncbi:MAG TPA: branched-chain amino acid ABC transporter substrate-binding protein [Aquabacterium sp.]|nr:branched-chain amino acid ABC transporter substrate-binding protein [Aquabacterium sp.]HSW06438.1 branched-chain amino acid ABC transporter substrate-binding protein [Aquabacterium sp.]
MTMVALMAVPFIVAAQQGPVVRIALIDPLSGPFANVGLNQLKEWQFTAERLSGTGNAAGVKFEIVGFDNKGSPQESLNTLRAAIDQGFRYVTQGLGSGAALAIADAVAKHNERNPGKEVLYLNHSAVDPALTNEMCSYWHFRLDADTSMKMEALAAFMTDQPKVKNVYLINQNYAHGHQVAKHFKEGIARKRPDVRIVGEDLHPIGQVKDFAPYVAKIRQSRADTIVTGNWGADLSLLVRALSDAGLKVPMYTYYATGVGVPTALSLSADSEVYVISYGHANLSGEVGQIAADFKKKFNEDYTTYSIYNGIHLLGAAIARAKSVQKAAGAASPGHFTDPVHVAKAFEGLSVKSFAGDVSMRASDHQLQQALFVSRWQKLDKKYAYSVENTGHTFAPVRQLDPYVASMPTSCQMKRPAAG